MVIEKSKKIEVLGSLQVKTVFDKLSICLSVYMCLCLSTLLERKLLVTLLPDSHKNKHINYRPIYVQEGLFK